MILSYSGVSYVIKYLGIHVIPTSMITLIRIVLICTVGFLVIFFKYLLLGGVNDVRTTLVGIIFSMAENHVQISACGRQSAR